MADRDTAWSARNSSVVWRKVDDEVVIMDLAPGVYYSLRGVGGAIWQLLAEAPRTTQQIVAALEHEYDVTQEVLHRDVERFLADLVAATLVTQNP